MSYKNVVLLKIVLSILLQLVISAKFDGADCRHGRTNSAGSCVALKECGIALNDLKNNRAPEICRIENGLPIACCPSQKSEEKLDKLLSSNTENDNANCYYAKTRTDGVCISIQNCKAAQQELELDILPQLCKVEAGLPVVCCPKNFGENRIVLRSQIGNLAQQKCEEYKEISKKLPFDSGTRIVGGEDAFPGEFPHLAVLGYGEGPEFEWKCAGSLISENFVLTAAHCLRNEDPVKVVQLGDVILNSTEAKKYTVKSFYKHPDHMIATSYNDIGLIQLEENVEFTPNIKPACLPRNSDNDQRQNLMVTGFGKTSFMAEDLSRTLQKVALDFFPRNECDSRYKRYRKFPNGVIEPLQLCYGSKMSNKDACQGDSGGPLQYFDHSSALHQVVGVVSVGIGCGNSQVPGIYTRTSFYTPWIESLVWGSKDLPENRDSFSIHKHIHNVNIFG